MTKRIVFGILGLIVVVTLGFSYKYLQDTDKIISQTPRIEEPKIISQMVNTGIVSTGSDIKSESEVDITSNLPLCENKLNPVVVTDMDKVVINCVEKKKEGREITELGGASTDFWIYNGKPTVPEQWQGRTYKPLCYSIDNDTKEKYTMYAVLEKNEEGTTTIQGYSALENILNKGILSSVAYSMYPDSMFCGPDSKNAEKIDPDCEDMKESESWRDGSNYFIAGYREETTYEKRYYVINGKVYNPGKSTINNHEINEIGQGRWQFITVRDNKIIVKRMKDEKHYPWKDQDSAINPSTYILQTCEIPL